MNLIIHSCPLPILCDSQYLTTMCQDLSVSQRRSSQSADFKVKVHKCTSFRQRLEDGHCCVLPLHWALLLRDKWLRTVSLFANIVLNMWTQSCWPPKPGYQGMNLQDNHPNSQDAKHVHNLFFSDMETYGKQGAGESTCWLSPSVERIVLSFQMSIKLDKQ